MITADTHIMNWRFCSISALKNKTWEDTGRGHNLFFKVISQNITGTQTMGALITAPIKLPGLLAVYTTAVMACKQKVTRRCKAIQSY